jgi:hypothetical protein
VTECAALAGRVKSSPGSALDAVRREWTRRIEAEYGSAAHTQHLTLWFMQLGVPRELLDDGIRIVQDELDHATLSARVVEQVGSLGPPALAETQLQLQRQRPKLIEDALSALVELFCLGETVAVPLFKELRSECSVPVAREALDRILKDEVRHRAFGWEALEYFVDTQATAVEIVTATLPGLFRKVLRLYGQVPEDALIIDPECRAWGLMPLALYRSILLETATSEYLPRFAQLGIDAGPAWQRALSST